MLENKKTIVVIDVSVLSHQISNRTADGVRAEVVASHAEAQLGYAASLLWLPLAVQKTVKGVVWVKDVKIGGHYWRHDYLQTPEVAEAILEFQRTNLKSRKRTTKTLHYKAGRKAATQEFLTSKDSVYSTIDRKGWHVAGFPAYEADDLMSTLVVLNELRSEPYNILLVTIDTDIMGLVSPHCQWYCMHGYSPRFRHNLDVCNEWFLNWLDRKANQAVKNSLIHMGSPLVNGLGIPSDIWTVKHLTGDKSDNLPPGTPLDAINLLAPPPEYRLWRNPDAVKILGGFLDSPMIPEVDVNRCLSYLRTIGVRPCISPWDPDSQNLPLAS